MTVCSTTALRKYLTQHSNLAQPSREKAVSTTRAHAEGETIINSGRYRRPLFKSSMRCLFNSLVSNAGAAHHWCMQRHEGEGPEPDPKERERQRQWTMTRWLALVIAVLLGVLTPMLLKRFF